MKTKWEEINNDLGEICTIEIPRFISCTGDVSYQLLCFCDGSKLAYSTAVYLKSTNGVNTNIHLIFSKTRVTPKTKKMSLPRLELFAVVLGCRCMKWIEKGMRLKLSEKHIWTDSQCVLKWMTCSKLLSVFVENRLQEVRNSNDIQFHYISTHENPSDLLTRGKCLAEIRL